MPGGEVCSVIKPGSHDNQVLDPGNPDHLDTIDNNLVDPERPRSIFTETCPYRRIKLKLNTSWAATPLSIPFVVSATTHDPAGRVPLKLETELIYFKPIFVSFICLSVSLLCLRVCV
jgi:hypothetical protein